MIDESDFSGLKLYEIISTKGYLVCSEIKIDKLIVHFAKMQVAIYGKLILQLNVMAILSVILLNLAFQIRTTIILLDLMSPILKLLSVS